MKPTQALKPAPIAELVISGHDRVLHITCVTADAREWIEAEAPRYGNLFREPHRTTMDFTYIVSEAYRWEDVTAYLRDGYQA